MSPAPLAVVSAFLEAEAALPSRSHGPKGRNAHLVCDVRTWLPALSREAILDGVEWALAGSRLGIVTTDQAAAWLVASWFAV